MTETVDYLRSSAEWRTHYKERLEAWGRSRFPDERLSWEELDRRLSLEMKARNLSGVKPPSVKLWRQEGHSWRPPTTEEVMVAVDELLDAGGRLVHLRGKIEEAMEAAKGKPTEGGFETEFAQSGGVPAVDEDVVGEHRDPLAERLPEDRSPEIEAAPQRHSGRRMTRRGAIALVAVVSLAVVAVVFRTGAAGDEGSSADGRTPATAPARRCWAAVGDLDGPAATDPRAYAWTTTFQAVFADAGGASVLGCVGGPAKLERKLLVQKVWKDGRTPNGVLLVVADDPGKGWWLNRSMWGSYTQIGGANGLAYQNAGTPTDIRKNSEDGHFEVTFSGGVIMVAEHQEAPYFWIIAEYVNWWRQHQSALGLPTSNPIPFPGGGVDGRQDFQRGYATVKLGDQPVEHLIPHPEMELPMSEEMRGKILGQVDRTSWWITKTGGRQWIPDGGVWGCKGGATKEIRTDVPGYAIAALPYEGLATC